MGYVWSLILVLFRVTALLSYNSHTVQFTHLNCTIQWVLGYSQSCATITTIVLEHFITQGLHLIKR